MEDHFTDTYPCPNCGKPAALKTDSLPGSSDARTYSCCNCGMTFTTQEKIKPGSVVPTDSENTEDTTGGK